MAGNRITGATSGNWRSAPGRASGSFRVELRADDIVARDDRRHRAAVVGGRDDVGGVGGVELKGVDEIGVQPVVAGRRCRRAAGAAAARRACSSPCAGSSARDRSADRRDVAGDPAEPGDRPRVRGRASPAAACRRRCRGTAGRAGAPLSSSASTMPGTASSPRRQSAKAPTPGSTMWSARTTSSGRRVTVTSTASPASRAARSNALRAECRLPEP